MPEHKHLPQHDDHAIELRPAPLDVERVDGAEPAAPVVGRAFGGDQDVLGGSPVAADTAAALRRRRGGGRALPTEVASQFGEQFGADFTGVRVHTDAEASRIARSVQATAFTHGSDIYFSEGTYSPGSATGQHLLAHELTHVVQQQNATPSAGGAPVVGKANDPAEHEAERMAGQVVGALRRSAAVAGPRPTEQAGDVQRLFGFGKKKDADGATKPVPATKRFGDKLTGKPPKDKGDAATRMGELRTLLTSMTPEERATIANDRKLMAKAHRYVGNHEFMTLVAAVGMSYKPPAKKGKPAAKAAVAHMSGAEADSFIQAQMGKIGHLMGFINTAVGAGKKADGFVAVVGQEDWESIYGQQYDKDEVGTDDELSTNAFIANTHADRPAIIHHERGTRSTAIHESMHRYSVLNVLNTFGFRLNEGMTEYFTRKITDKDGNPTNGNAGASTRDNYQANFDFVQSLLSMLGDTAIEQETALAQIYFSGDTALLKTTFETKCKAGGLTEEETAERWKDFSSALSTGNWNIAVTKLPPPPAKKKAKPKKDAPQPVGAGA